MTVHYRTCNLCEAMCGLEISVEAGAVTGVRGDAEDPFSHGHVCPKAVALKDIHEDPDRLRRPLKRTAGGWEEISWTKAFDEVAEKLLELRSKHGANSIAVYQGNPTVHNHGSMIHGQVFVRALKTKNRYSATSLDQLPHMLAALEMFGHQLLLPIPDVDRTSYFLILGANPVVSNGSLMTAPGIEKRIQEIRKRGGQVVVVDPRFTETAAIADRHLFIRPGTDALFLLGVLHDIFAGDRVNLGRCAAFVDGLERVAAAVKPFPPEQVADRTGMEVAAIRAVARELTSAKSAVVYGRVGVCTQEFGGLSAWLINVINVITGNFDRPGGSMFTRPAIDVVAATAKLGQAGHFARRRSRVRGLPEFGGEYPAAVMAEEMETPGEGQIRALVTSAGNPVLSSPNGRRLEKALAGLELMVSIDFYLNETTRHAHYILPPTSPLEHPHYDLAFHLLAVRNTAKYSPALFEKPAGALHDWEIFSELAMRLETGAGPMRLLKPLATRAMRMMKPERVLDLGLRRGPYSISLSKLAREPHGVDLGPLEPCLPERLFTRDRRIHLAPEMYLADLERLRARIAVPPAPEEELVLIGRRELRTNNSWMHNSERLVKGKERCTLRMNPRDAEKRGLEGKNGAEVEIASAKGKVTAKLELTEELMPGVVSLPHGWGHDREGTRLRVANAHRGASINDLTDEDRVDALSGTISFSGVPVKVTAAL